MKNFITWQDWFNSNFTLFPRYSLIFFLSNFLASSSKLLYESIDDRELSVYTKLLYFTLNDLDLDSYISYNSN